MKFDHFLLIHATKTLTLWAIWGLIQAIERANIKVVRYRKGNVMPKSVFQLLVIIFLSFFMVDFVISSEAAENYKNRFKGWEGVAFFCHGEEHTNPICPSIEIDAEFLATASGINFSKVKGWFEAFDLQLKKNYLTLEVIVSRTSDSLRNSKCIACAIHVRLHTYIVFSKGSEYNPNGAFKGPMYNPRMGSFDLWVESSLVSFNGPWSMGIDSIVKTTEKQLKEFFILFMKANPK